MRTAITAGLILAAAGIAHAEPAAPAAPAGDAYCEHVESVAASESDVLMGPELFGSLGYIEAADISTTPIATNNDARVIAGVRIKLGGLYQGFVTRDHARQDCRRHQAIDQVVGASAHAALEARAKVFDDALPQAQKILSEAQDELADRRANAQDVTATRLRVEELRQLAAETRRQLDALPAVREGSLSGALASYYDADARVEQDEGKLRSAAGWDVSVRLGVSEFLTRDNPQPYFAVVSATFDLGWLFTGGNNARALSSRKQLVQEAHADDQVGATVAQLKNQLAAESGREGDTHALEKDLERQLADLKGMSGDATKRYRETVWFEWVKARADHEYLAAHVAALRQVLGEAAPAADGAP